MAIQADKPKDDWYELVKELKDRELSKKKSSEEAQCSLQDTKSVTLDANGADKKDGSKSPRRISLNAWKEKLFM